MGFSVRFASFLVLFFALQTVFTVKYAHAQVQIDSASGVSSFVAATTGTGSTNTTATIYAGIAGDMTTGACATADGTSTCSNCAADQLACSERRIYSNLKLKINFKVTGDLTGYVKVWGSPGGATDSTSIDFTTSSGRLVKNNTGTVTMDWGDVCTAIDAGTDCDAPSLAGHIYIGIVSDTSSTDDPESGKYGTVSVKVVQPDTGSDTITCSDSPEKDGICTFIAYPGDEKIYVTELDARGNYPDHDNVPYKFLRVFASTVSFADITYATELRGDLDIDSDGGVSPEKMDGLENEQTYFFRLAMVDAAYNVSLLTSDQQITDDNCGTNDDTLCPLMATPSDVYGLLEKDFNCFISTAAYGSSMAPKVQDFRVFRNHFLIPYNLGRKFVYYYYNVGPKAAAWMWEHPWSRPAVRAALWPVWIYAVIANSAGIFIANITFIFIFALVAYSVYALRNRKVAVKVRRDK